MAGQRAQAVEEETSPELTMTRVAVIRGR